MTEQEYDDIVMRGMNSAPITDSQMLAAREFLRMKILICIENILSDLTNDEFVKSPDVTREIATNMSNMRGYAANALWLYRGIEAQASAIDYHLMF